MLTFYINLTFHAYFVCVVLFTYPNIQISMNELSCLSSLMLSCLVHLGLHAYFRRACLLLLALPVLHSFAATLAASLAACALGASALTEPWLALGCHVLSDPLCHAVSGTLTHPTERTRNRPHVDVRAVGREPGPDPTFWWRRSRGRLLVPVRLPCLQGRWWPAWTAPRVPARRLRVRP